MGYMSWDEVRGLDKFFIGNNREATGFEMRIGCTDRDGSEPETVRYFSAEELSGAELITCGYETFCALAGDCLYYRTEYGIVESIRSEYTASRYSKSAQKTVYDKITITFSDTVVILPDEEIIPLDKILVKNNKYIGSITVIPGYYGVGGSNRSGFQGKWDSAVEYTAEELDGSEPIRVMGWEICALINDALYLRYKSDNGEIGVFSVDRRKGEQIYLGDDAAYDTLYAKKVKLNRK